MGCIQAKKSITMASNSENVSSRPLSPTSCLTPPNRGLCVRAWQNFVPFGQQGKVEKIDDLVIKRRDFVVEYQDIDVFYQNYEMDSKVLGRGAFGKVQKVKNKRNNEMRAVKIIDKLQLEEADRVRLKYEIEILKNLNHPNIVRLYEVYENRSTIFMVQELCSGCELFEEIVQRRHFTENEAAIVLKQILQAISYCHQMDIAHRDLKPENILIDVADRGSIKVIDFGTSHHFDKAAKEMKQAYGTPYYIAPEVLRGSYNEKCDLWSIGVILYIMLCGVPPFNGTDRQIIERVKVGSWEFKGEVWTSISPEAKDLVSRLMQTDVKKRLTAVEALQHPWLQQKVRKTYSKTLATKAVQNLMNFRVSG